MNKPRGTIDDALSPSGQFIHDNRFWGIGGVNVTTRWMPQQRHLRIAFHCDKRIGQRLTRGHADILEALVRSTGYSTAIVVWMTSNGDVVKHWRPGWDIDRTEPFTNDDYRLFLDDWAKDRP